MLNAYSKVYNSVVKYPVAYRNLPENRVLVNQLPGEISLMLRAQGFSLLYEQMRGSRDTIEVDVSGLNIYRRGQVYSGLLSTRDKIDEITRQFNPEISLLKITPDTIRFSFATRRKKEVSVKLVSDITFERQYQLEGKVIHEPASVTVSGPDFILDTLRFVYTDSVILQNLTETTSTEVDLQVPDDHPALRLGAGSVKVTVPVERYTEAEVSVLVDPVNIPSGYGVKLIPEKVNVTYLVPFSKFDDVTARSFSAKVDFRKYDQQKRLPVEIISLPDFVSLVRVEPSKVEFILSPK